jgi:dTDP-4-dehydrorhamnose reductase
MAEASKWGHVTATYCNNRQPGSYFFDVRNSGVSTLLSNIPEAPTVAVVMLGITSIDACARDPDATSAINVFGIIRVIDELYAVGILPVFISSDGVFDGLYGPYSETACPNPILTYGRQKLAVERYIESTGKLGMVVRLPKILATDFDPRCLIASWVAALGRPEVILCANDQYFTPASVPDVCNAIVKLIIERAAGVFHLGGPDRISRRDLLGMVVEEYRKYAEPAAVIVNCSLRDIPVLEPRPLDTSLDSRKFQEHFRQPFSPIIDVVSQAVRSSFEGLRAEN